MPVAKHETHERRKLKGTRLYNANMACCCTVPLYQSDIIRESGMRESAIRETGLRNHCSETSTINVCLLVKKTFKMSRVIIAQEVLYIAWLGAEIFLLVYTK